MENQKEIKKLTKNKFNTVNVIAGINIILLIGLALLYVLYFTGNDNGQQEATENTPSITETITGDSNITIVFVNKEEVLESYYLTDKLRRDFEAEKNRLERQFMNKQEEIRRDFEEFQRNMQSGLLRDESAQRKEQELMIAQQELYEMNELFTERLIRKEQEMQLQLADSLSSFLEEYNKDKNYHYILSYTIGGSVLYGSPAFDITKDVVKEIKKVTP